MGPHEGDNTLVPPSASMQEGQLVALWALMQGASSQRYRDGHRVQGSWHHQLQRVTLRTSS